jgi:hypothetical protein
MTTTMQEGKSAYPASLVIDYPDRKLNRLTSFFRVFWVIPIAIILGLMTDTAITCGTHLEGWRTSLSAGGLLVIPLVLMILFRAKYPRWWFDWNLAFTRFVYRVSAYMLLLRDEYPSTDEEQSVHLELRYPDIATELDRAMPLIKWFLAIPHYIVLACLAVAVVVIWIIAWFAILFTGRYPRGMFDFTVGVLRWGLRVSAYAFLLVTDKYPAFSMEA